MASPRRWVRDKWRRLKDAIGVTGVVVLVPTLLVLLVYVALFARAMLRQWTLKHLITLLYLWQTQTGAAFALAAALVGAIALVRQTTATERRAKTRRARRAAALRAVLPLMLTELTDYAERCVTIFSAVLKRNLTSLALNPAERSAPQQLWWVADDEQLPPLPERLVEQLIELIETSEPDHARPLILLARSVQLQHARARELRGRVVRRRDVPQGGATRRDDGAQVITRANVVDRVIDAAEVLARCEKLFGYARGDAESPPAPISADDVDKAMQQMRTARALLNEEQWEREFERYAAAETQLRPWPEQIVTATREA